MMKMVLAAAMLGGTGLVATSPASAETVCRHGRCWHVRERPGRYYWHHRNWREGAYYRGRYFHDGYWYPHRHRYWHRGGWRYRYSGPSVRLGIAW